MRLYLCNARLFVAVIVVLLIYLFRWLYFGFFSILISVYSFSSVSKYIESKSKKSYSISSELRIICRRSVICERPPLNAEMRQTNCKMKKDKKTSKTETPGMPREQADERAHGKWIDFIMKQILMKKENEIREQKWKQIRF